MIWRRRRAKGPRLRLEGGGWWPGSATWRWPSDDGLIGWGKVGVVIGGGVAGAVGAAMWFVAYQVSVHNFLVNVFGPSAAGWFDVAIKYVVALVT